MLTKRNAILCGALAAIFTFLAVAPASAQDYYRIRRTRPSRFFFEIGTFFDGDHSEAFDTSVFVLTPYAQGNFRLARSFELEVKWGFSYGSIEGDFGVPPLVARVDESGVVIANPQIGALWAHDGPVMIRLGGALVLPLLDVDDPGQQTAAGLGSAIRGLHDLWMWSEGFMSLVAPVYFEGGSGSLVWEAEGALGFMIPVRDDAGDDTEFVFQTAGGLGGRVGSMVIGGRLRLVWLMSGPDGGDNAQLSMEPFIRIGSETGYFSARLLLNLDEPFGFALDEDGVWGLHMGGGFAF